MTGRNPCQPTLPLRDQHARGTPGSCPASPSGYVRTPAHYVHRVGCRGEQAGIQNVHPHRFRRSFADSWLAAGGSTDDLMHITGWKTYDMVREYTEQRGIARAHSAHARLSPGDRI